jgi:hypothetical protein
MGAIWPVAALLLAGARSVKRTSLVDLSRGRLPSGHHSHRALLRRRTKNVPRHFEKPELGCLQKCSDHLLRIEAVRGRERQHVDAVEVAIVTMLDQLLDLVDIAAKRLQAMSQP